jgi:hypothetical protein
VRPRTPTLAGRWGRPPAAIKSEVSEETSATNLVVSIQLLHVRAIYYYFFSEYEIFLLVYCNIAASPCGPAAIFIALFTHPSF